MPRSKIAQHALVTHMLEAENPNWSILSTGCLVGSMDSDRPELVGDERHVPNRGAALRWIQAGSYRLPIHLAKRVGRLARWHGLCERLVRFIGQI